MVTVTTNELHDLASRLKSEARVSCRLMLRKSDRHWKLQGMMVDAPAVASSEFSYDYDHTAFVGGTIKGSRLASWLLRGKAGFRNFHFAIPKLQERINSQRYPSRVQRNIWLSIPQPFSLHTINIMERNDRQSAHSPLVNEGCPSFRNIAAAAANLIYGEKASTGQREPDEIHIRIAHPEAMIEQVLLHKNRGKQCFRCAP